MNNIKHFIQNSVILLSIIIGITNCDPCKRLTKLCPAKDSISYVETVTENPYYTIPDTAYWNLQFSCDSNYNVILRELEDASNTMHTETIIKEVVRYKTDNTKVTNLLVSLKAISDSILVRDKLIEKLRNEVKTVTVEKEVVKFKSRKFFIYSTFVLYGLILLGLVFTWFKFKTKILKIFG